MKPADLRNESADHLKVMLKDKRKAVLEWRMKSVAGEGLNPHEVSSAKKDIARILTVLGDREKQQAAAKAESKE